MKIEDKYGYATWAHLPRPGISFGEGGPGDMALSFGFPSQTEARLRKIVQDNIFHAAKGPASLLAGSGRGRWALAEIWTRPSQSTIKEGHMIGSGEQIAAAGRKYTKRPLPY